MHAGHVFAAPDFPDLSDLSRPSSFLVSYSFCTTWFLPPIAPLVSYDGFEKTLGNKPPTAAIRLRAQSKLGLPATRGLNRKMLSSFIQAAACPSHDFVHTAGTSGPGGLFIAQRES